jgi:hypothetical protein
MKSIGFSTLVLLMALHCSHEEEALKRSTALVTAGSASQVSEDAGQTAPRSDGSPELASVEEVDRFLSDRYRDLIPRSEEQRKAVIAADEYLDRRRTIVARPRRYLVRKTSSGWDVTVISLAALRRAEQKRSGSIIVSLVDDHGHLEGRSVGVQE